MKNHEYWCLEARRTVIYEVKYSRCNTNSLRSCLRGSLNQRVLFDLVFVRVNIEAAMEGLAGNASFPGANNVPDCHYPRFKSLALSLYLISQKYCDNSKNHKSTPAEPGFCCILFYHRIIRGATIFGESWEEHTSKGNLIDRRKIVAEKKKGYKN